MTNVTPNHLDHHKDMQEYIDAKRNILLYQKPPCRAVLGYENEISRAMQKDCKGEQVWFTRLHETDNGAFLRKEDNMLCYGRERRCDAVPAPKEIQLRGLHNVENLLAAAPPSGARCPSRPSVRSAPPLPAWSTALSRSRTLDGVLYYNDSIGTSPTRTIAGLRSFDQKIILIAGGYDKKIPYEPLAPEVVAHVKTLVLMGATGPRIEKAVREGPGFPRSRPDHPARRQYAARRRAGPRCRKTGRCRHPVPPRASFDLYPNFEVARRDYKNIVNNLKS